MPKSSETLHEMSDTLEIVEITDSSINIEVSPELKESVNSVLQNATKTKRRMSDPELDVRSPKKICADDDDKATAELIVRRVCQHCFFIFSSFSHCFS